MAEDCGVVAVVQGLRDAGLRVTMMDRRRLYHSRKSQNYVPISRSSVDTNTDSNYQQNAAAQICDGRYASSYQLAHCCVTPTSPVTHLPEFPPQRTQPCRTQGNFEVGGYGGGGCGGCGEINYSSIPSQTLRGDLVWPNRGSVYSSHHSRTIDPFIHSLRQYPLSPDRSVSAELVQQLINYAQAKYLSRSNSKSSRSLHKARSRDKKTANVQTYTGTKHENLPTYTRTQLEKDRQELPTREDGCCTSNEVKISRKKSFSRSPYDSTYKTKSISDTYNYLRASRRAYSRSPEVRYLNDVKKYIRDTVNHICDDTPVMCPSIQNRYTRHVRLHHSKRNGSSRDSATCPATRSTEAQVSMPSTSREPTVSAPCRPATSREPTVSAPCRPATPARFCPGSPRICSSCHKPLPCACPNPSISFLDEPIIIPDSETEITCPCPPGRQGKHDGKRIKDHRQEKNSEKGIEDNIFEWLKELPVFADDSSENKVKREEMVRQLAVKLESLKDDEDNEDKMKSEILKCIEKLPIWYPGAKADREKFKKQFSNSLFTKIKSDINDRNLKNAVADWLDVIDFETEHNQRQPMDKETVVENFVNRLKPVINGPAGELKNEVTEMLHELPIQISGNISKVLNELADKLINKIVEIKSEIIDNVKEIQTESKETEIERQIWDWLQNSTDLPQDCKKIAQKLVQNFAKTLEKLQTENANEDVIENKIKDFLTSVAQKGITISYRNRDQAVKNLLRDLKSKPKERRRWSQKEDLEQSILSEIDDLVEDIPNNINRNKRNEIKKKVARVITQNVDNLSENEKLNIKILSILKKEAEMPENEATDLANAIVNRVKGMPLADLTNMSFLPGRSTFTDTELSQYVKQEVSDILNEFNVSAKDRKDIEQNITDVLTDQIVRGTDNNKTKQKIISILQDANISDDAFDISNRLVERNNEMSLSFGAQDARSQVKSILGHPSSGLNESITKGTTVLSPMEKQAYEESAEREIIDFLEDITGDDNLRTRMKRKADVGQLVQKLGEIISDPNQTDKEGSMMNEVSQYLRRLSIESDVPREELAKQLASRLQRTFKTSTPKAHSFFPRRDMTDLSSIQLIEEDLTSQTKECIRRRSVNSNKERQYMNELITHIKSWINELPINLNSSEDKGFKETMIKDLAGDIIDRQKYLQLNPDAKRSSQEELEHLKYQVFRWLNKLVDNDNLSSVMPKTESLMEKLKGVPVPELAKLSGKRVKTKQAEGQIPDVIDVIEDEISMWLNEISPNLYDSTDEKNLKEPTRELAQKIHKLRNDNRKINIDNEIEQCLGKLNKYIDGHDLKRMTETLKSRLKQKGLADDSLIMSQDSSEFIEENLVGGILDWLKDLPLYQRRTSSEKRMQENLVKEMVKGLKSVVENVQSQMNTDADKLLMEEILNHLKKFPMEDELKSDESFLRKTALQMLHHLKSLQLFQDISVRKSQLPDEYLIANIDDWMSSLPITRMNSSEKLKFENLKAGFINRIKQLRQAEPTDDMKLRDEIKNYLLKFPLQQDIKQNEKLINDQVQTLLKRFLAVPIERREAVSENDVKNAIENWLRSLLLKKGKSLKEIPSEAVQDFISATSQLFVNVDEIQINDIKNNLLEELTELLNWIPKDPNAAYDIQSLAEDLFSAVKEVAGKTSVFSRGTNIIESSEKYSLSSSRGTETEPILRIPVQKKAADVLFDNIETWCDNLPIKGETPRQIEKAKKVKQEIASKLIHKVGKLNMNPEVFNDDFLYEEILQDEIDNLLVNIISSEDIRNNLPSIKKDLMDKVKEARQKTQEETVAQVYKQQLRDAISKTLPSQALDAEEQAYFEVLKDSVADAFINLHYVGRNGEQKNRFKKKIIDEVDKFCNDYLKKHPATPIDGRKLNQDLYSALKNVPIPKEETLRHEVDLVKIKDEVNDWARELPFKQQTRQEELQASKMISVLAKKLLDAEKQKEISPEIDYDSHAKKEVKKWLKKLPLNIDKEEEFEQLADKLITNLKNTETSRRVSASTRHSIDRDVFEIPSSRMPSVDTQKTFVPSMPPSTLSTEDRAYLERIRARSPLDKAADVLFDNIETWCDNLPIKGDTPRQIEKAKKFKQEIASKLIHKVGKLNMNPEVFNDDFLYEEILQDEIDNLLVDVSSEDIRNNLPSIKKDLMDKVKEARQKTQEETVAQVYKQQLRDAISKTLPSQALDAEEQAYFEVLKDSVADAFINLHYVGRNGEQTNRFKKKIIDEVDKFCNDYLKKHPATPIDGRKLNQDLYSALKNVPIPKEETLRHEVDLVKIKDEVNDWARELPFKQQTRQEELQTSKMISVLAKKLLDAEKQKEISPEIDYDSHAKKEVKKWLKKLPLNINKEEEFEQLADKLITNLKNTETSRRVSASTRHSIDRDVFEIPSSRMPSVDTQKTFVPSIPPSTLSTEDRAYLERIRARSPLSKSPDQATQPKTSKDASISPLPVDVGSQTEVRPDTNVPALHENLTKQSSSIQTPAMTVTSELKTVGSQVGVMPHVVVKEYYWDSIDSGIIPNRVPCAPCPGFPFTPSQQPPSVFQAPPPCQPPPQPCQVVEKGSQAIRPCSQRSSQFTTQGAQRPCSPCVTPPVRACSSRGAVPSAIPSRVRSPCDIWSKPMPRRPVRKEWESQPYCYQPQELPVSSDECEPGTSRSFRNPRVTHLGSFDEIPEASRPRKDDGIPKTSRKEFDDANDDFWDNNRRLILSDEDFDVPFVKEREKREEKMTCKCKERVLTKCSGRRRNRGCQPSCQSCNDDSVKKCYKCCGVHCPYPSYLYFRQ